MSNQQDNDKTERLIEYIVEDFKLNDKNELVCTGEMLCSSLSKIGKAIHDEYQQFTLDTLSLREQIDLKFKEIKNDEYYKADVPLSGQKDVFIFVSHAFFVNQEIYDGIVEVKFECNGQKAITNKVTSDNPNFYSIVKLY